MSEPFEPNPHDDEERIAAADPGPGGPEPAPGFGIGGEDPDRADDGGAGERSDVEEDGDAETRARDRANPFRTPEVPPHDG